jgi:hypothetical protein
MVVTIPMDVECVPAIKRARTVNVSALPTAKESIVESSTDVEENVLCRPVTPTLILVLMVPVAVEQLPPVVELPTPVSVVSVTVVLKARVLKVSTVSMESVRFNASIGTPIAATRPAVMRTVPRRGREQVAGNFI